MSEQIPPSLAHLKHYFDADKIEWSQAEPGWGVVIEAQDIKTNSQGSFGFQIVDKERLPNGLQEVWMELDDTSYHFVEDTDERKPIILPKGTLMKAGVSCQHFPRTNAYMTYFGGIAVGRDFSFEEVQEPDGRIVGGVLVARVQAVHSFLPESKNSYTPPASYRSYRETIAQAKDSEKQGYEAWAANLDTEIAKSLEEYYPDRFKREAIWDVISTFHPEGRYKLAILLEYAHEDGVLDRFLPVLTETLAQEFVYAHPSIRGLDILPASQRGWAKMVRDLGLRNPRPTQETD
jgi:hypothetical protein